MTSGSALVASGPRGCVGRVARQTINAIETERYDPSLPLAFEIARLFGRPVGQIFQDE